MLTEVTFCITCYLTVLLIEYLPIVLKNRKLREVPSFLVFEFHLHKLIYVLAGVGTFLSFFHQGSLGGLVRRAARPAVRVPRRSGDLAVDVFPVHHFGRGGGAELRAADDVAGGEDHAEAAGAVRRCCSCWGGSPACCSRFTCWRRPSTRWCGSIARRRSPASRRRSITAGGRSGRGSCSRRSCSSACCRRWCC